MTETASRYERNGSDPVRRIIVSLFIFLSLALYDAVFGGAIAALLQEHGWELVAQRINNVYQLSYGVVVVSVLLLTFLHGGKREALAVVALFVGYVEDSLFYVLVKAINPMVEAVSLGAGYRGPETVLPENISGWVGWCTRMAGHDSWRMNWRTLLIANGGAVIAALVILLLPYTVWKKGELNNPEMPESNRQSNFSAE